MPKLNVNGATVNYAAVGSGEPVILLHCSSSSMSQWRSLWEVLEDDFQVLAPDLYDYGGTATWSGDTSDLLKDEAEIVLALAKRRGGKFHLVGHSYGGAVALRLASEHQDRLFSLVLIEPMACWLLDPGEPADHYAEIKQVAETYRDHFASGDLEGAVKPYVEYWNGDGAWQAMNDDFRNYVLGTAEKTHHEFAAIFDPTNYIRALESLDIPTLVIRGGATHPPTRRITEIIVETMPRTQLTVIEGAGHMSPLTHGEQVNTAIRRHLEGCR